MRDHAVGGRCQRDIDRHRAPEGIERVDKKTNFPGSQDEVHVNGGAVRRDGTIKHQLKKPLNNSQKEWMRKWGFRIPSSER